MALLRSSRGILMLKRAHSAPVALYHKNVRKNFIIEEVAEVVESFMSSAKMVWPWRKKRYRIPSSNVICVSTKTNRFSLACVCAFNCQVIDHYENPRNVGSLDKKDTNVGTGLVGAPACGDVMKLQIQVDENGKIIDAKFKTFGCGSAIASSSLATEWVKGKTIDEAGVLKNSDIAKELSLPPVKLHCSSMFGRLLVSHVNR